MPKQKRNRHIKELFNAQDGLCFYCGEEMSLYGHFNKMATIDHIVPKKVLKDLGINPKDLKRYNEVAACADCNNQKSDKPVVFFINELSK